MRFFQALRALLQTWQGVVLTILAILGAIYYGPRKMLETWDWYLDRYRDHEIAELLKRPNSKHFVSLYGGHHIVPWPPSIKEIAERIGRSPTSVRNSLRRLERRGKVVERSDGWHLKDES